MRSYQFPYMSNFDDYSYPYFAYAAAGQEGGCWKDKSGQWVFNDNEGGCGYSKVSCAAAKANCNAPPKRGVIAKLTGTTEGARQRACKKAKGSGIIPFGNSPVITGFGCTDEEIGVDIPKGVFEVGKSPVESVIGSIIPGGGGGGDGDGQGSDVCKKNCGQLELLCYLEKMQAACGGGAGLFTGGCFGIGIPNVIPLLGEAGCMIIPAIIGVIVLLMVLKR